MTPSQAKYQTTLVRCPSWFQGMGALELQPDPRDRQTRHDPAIQAIMPQLPVSSSLLEYVTGPSYDQDGTGACVAASTSGVCSLDTQHFQGAWHVFHWLQLYHEAGGTGSNGVDSRLVLQICKGQGTPLAAGGREFVIDSYDFISQRPGVFRDEVKACIALGFPVVFALLLPMDFGAVCGQLGVAVTQGYHQLKGLFYDADYLGFRNSWGDSWPGAGSVKPGVGKIRWDYLEQSNMQNLYCYAYRTTAKGGIIPPPPPAVTVTGYQPNPVPSGANFSIAGTGFDQGSLSMSWQGIALPVLGVNPTALATKAPATPGSGPVHVQAGNGSADGPILTVTAPDPPPVKTRAAVTGAATGSDVSGLAPGQTYPLGNGITLVLSTVTFGDAPPAPLTVTGYNPPSAQPGQVFLIFGSGFSAPGALIVRWGQTLLTAGRISDTVIEATAPAGANGTNATSVQIGATLVTGPLLLIGDGGPPPVEEIKVLITTKPSALRNALSIVAYTADANGGSFPASVSGSVVGPNGTVDLWGLTTHGTQSPAIWQIARPAPWGTPCKVEVHAFSGGKTGTGTAVG